MGELANRLTEIPRDREVWTICRSGRRAARTASLLDGSRIPVTAVTRGGVANVVSQQRRAAWITRFTYPEAPGMA